MYPFLRLKMVMTHEVHDITSHSIAFHPHSGNIVLIFAFIRFLIFFIIFSYFLPYTYASK